MIIIFQNGRFGNQMFQYAAIRELFPEEIAVFMGFDELKSTLDDLDAIFVTRERRYLRILQVVIQHLVSVSGRLRLIGVLAEERSDSEYVLKESRGVISAVRTVHDSYFQHHELFRRWTFVPRIKEFFCDRAQQWFELHTDVIAGRVLVFVHVRRGDYVYWPSRDAAAVVDLAWYWRGMEYVRARVERPLFVVLGDDLYYARDVFGGARDVLISENDPSTDFALMSRCLHGVLSPSSFAWWGATLAHSASSDGVFVAPKYWVGHRVSTWYPPGIETEWITYLE